MNRAIRISLNEKYSIVSMQGGRCIYCALPFGTIVECRGRTPPYETLMAEVEHFIPVSFGERAHGNLVAACQICNKLKGALLFPSVELAAYYILTQWTRKGYKIFEYKVGGPCWNCIVLWYGPYSLLFTPVPVGRQYIMEDYEDEVEEDFETAVEYSLIIIGETTRKLATAFGRIPLLWSVEWLGSDTFWA